MGPIRILLLIFLVVVLAVSIYAVAAIFSKVIDQLYMYSYGTNFSWTYLPAPLADFGKFSWNTLLPYLFIIGLVLGIVIEFVIMYAKTHEAQVWWMGGV